VLGDRGSKVRISKAKLATITVIAALAAGVVAYAQDDGSSDQGTRGPRGEVAAPPTKQVGEDLRSRFGILRRDRRASDDPPALARGVRAPGSPAGANLGLARRAAVARPATAAYVVPGEGQVCLVLISGEVSGGGCATPSEAANGYTVSSVAGSGWGLEGHELIVYGLVPDGVDHVRFRFADGETADVPVGDNLFLKQVAQEVRTVEWDGAQGTVARRVP
jgi:hypothetical protein